MEKGRTYFEQDVAFMHEMEFDTVKIDQCGEQRPLESSN